MINMNVVIRIAGASVLTLLTANLGVTLAGTTPNEQQQLAILLLTLSGFVLGFIITPRLTTIPLRRVLQRLRTTPIEEIIYIATGGFLGLVWSVLLSVPLLLLPAPLSQFLPISVTLMLTYLGAAIFATHRQGLENLQRWLRRRGEPERSTAAQASQAITTTGARRCYLLDTSAIIDGRIAEVAKTGFIEGTLLVPQFVLQELQTLADSADDLRRSKGRRGLDLLNQMQKNLAQQVEIMETDVGENGRVDDSLVLLARQTGHPIITNDFNLNRVAGLQGVRVLSLNQLSEAVRPPVVQDQRLVVLIRNEGNTRQQGVGYLEDGTPVVVEEARHLIGERVPIIVTRVLQTNTGRLVFAQVDHTALADLPAEQAVTRVHSP